MARGNTGGAIRVSAVVFRDSSGRVLTVRKRGTTRFMLPGGKPEPTESAPDAAIRECAEELGVTLDQNALQEIGRFRAPAANENGTAIEATVFEHPVIDAARPAAEIAEVRWLAPSAQSLPADLAPLLSVHVLPALGWTIKASKSSWVTVFAGAADGADAIYAKAIAELASTLAMHGIGIVYGGGKVGLMGHLADAMLSSGAQVIGVMPRALVDREIAHPALTRLEVVNDMHERKLRMAELGQAFVALPGGVGTLEEFFEVWSWQQLGIHTKPVALYDINGFWQPLLGMADRMVDQQFLASQYRQSLIVAGTPDELLRELAQWQPPASRWTHQSATTP